MSRDRVTWYGLLGTRAQFVRHRGTLKELAKKLDTAYLDDNSFILTVGGTKRRDNPFLKLYRPGDTIVLVVGNNQEEKEIPERFDTTPIREIISFDNLLKRLVDAKEGDSEENLKKTERRWSVVRPKRGHAATGTPPTITRARRSRDESKDEKKHETEEKEHIDICVSGDIMVGRSFDKLDPTSISPTHFWSQDIIGRLTDSDYWIFNLETSITDRTMKDTLLPHKTFNFKLSPHRLSSILPFTKKKKNEEVRPQLVANVANNHSLDYGVLGMRDTMNTLTEHGIDFAGASSEPFRVVGGGDHGVIGMIGVTDHPREWSAHVNYVDLEDKTSVKRQLSLISELSRHVSVPIVSAHLGANYQPRIPDSHRDFARGAIDAGAKIVAITSPHHLMPLEHYRKGIIFYSLGDALDDYAIDPEWRNDLSVLVRVRLSPPPRYEIESLHLYPTRIAHMSTHLVQKHDPDYQRVLDMLLPRRKSK